MTTRVLGTVQINNQGRAVLELDTSNLDAGQYQIIATHNQDNTYKEASTTQTLTLNPQPITFTITNVSYVEAGEAFSFDIVCSIPINYKLVLKRGGQTVKENGAIKYFSCEDSSGVAHITLDPNTMNITLTNGTPFTVNVSSIALKGGLKSSNYSFEKPSLTVTPGEVYIKHIEDAIVLVDSSEGLALVLADFVWNDNDTHGSQLSQNDVLDLLEDNNVEFLVKIPNRNEMLSLTNMIQEVDWDGAGLNLALFSGQTPVIDASEYIMIKLEHSNPDIQETITIFNEDYFRG